MREPEVDYEPTSSDARRERNERAVFTRLNAIEAAGRSGALPLEPPSRRFAFALGGLALAGAAAVVLLLLFKSGPTPSSSPAPSPSLVVTPVGGSSRFTVGDSIIDAGGDTSVEVVRATDGATTLKLARGTIDCEVAPRNGRPPFRVLAGDVTVEVVGTRFAVTRKQGCVRVDVTHGRVHVTSAPQDEMLGAGGSWTSCVETAATSEPAPSEAPADVEMPDDKVEPVQRAKQPSPREILAAASRLEADKPADAARAYRTIANGKDSWAALALYSLAELHAKSDPAAALAELDEYARRFPRGPNTEDTAWLRVNVLRRTGRGDDARRAAAAYLREYPNGTYVQEATRIASP